MRCSLVERCCFCFQCRCEEWRWKEQSPLKPQPNCVASHSKTVTWMLSAVYSDSWIFCSWNLHSPWLYALFIGSTKASIRRIHFPWMYVCAPTQFLCYTFRRNLNWPVAVVLSPFNWKSGNRSDFQLQFLTHISPVVMMPYALCIVYSVVIQLRYWHWSILTADLQSPDQWW